MSSSGWLLVVTGQATLVLVRASDVVCDQIEIGLVLSSRLGQRVLDSSYEEYERKIGRLEEQTDHNEVVGPVQSGSVRRCPSTVQFVFGQDVVSDLQKVKNREKGDS